MCNFVEFRPLVDSACYGVKCVSRVHRILDMCWIPGKIQGGCAIYDVRKGGNESIG